jgi:UDP-glucose:(heptosyl)LPS alpha-1,3-glucosyltransferase
VKIAVVIERLEAWRGGAETSTMELSRLLTARGHDVHIVTMTNAPSPPDVTICPISVSTALRPRRTATFIRKATAFLHENPFDLIHAVSPIPYADLYQPRGGLVQEIWRRNAATRSSLAGRAMKIALTALSIKQRSLLDLERAVFRNGGPVILAVSKYVADQCKTYYGLADPRVRVVFNGVNIAETSPLERAAGRAAVRGQYHLSDDTLVLLFVGHNFRLKGLSPLIDTTANLAASGFTKFHLLVAGRDNPVPYQRRIHSLGLDRFVTFTGSTERMTSFFHAADVCVHPTYFDPCSRVVLEALSHGLPCITTAFNGAAEVMTDGREGFVIDSPEAVETWADRIRQLSSEPLRRKMSQNALLLRETVSMSRHVKELDALFVEMAEHKRRCCRSAC